MAQINVQRMAVDFQDFSNVQKKKESKDATGEFKKMLKDKPEQETEVSKDTSAKEKKTEGTTSSDKKEVDEATAAMQVSQLLRGNCVVEVPQELENTEVSGEMQLNLEVAGTAEVGAEQTDWNLEQAGTEEVMGTQAQVQGQEAHVQQHTELPTETKVSHVSEKRQEKNSTTISKATKEVAEEGNPALEQAMQAGEQTTHVEHSVVERAKLPTEQMQVERPEEIPEKLSEEVLRQVSKGIDEFEIQIEPEHLGKIAIKVMFQEGQTTVLIACSEKQTQHLIGQRAAELGQVMERNLGEETVVYVEKQQPDYLNQNQRENDHSGRESEQDRQREEQQKQTAEDPIAFLQKLRLGLGSE